MINLVNSIKSYPNVEISDLTTSEAGRAVKLVKISDPEVNDSAKFLVWAIARQHAFECHSNYVTEGLIRYLVSGDPGAKRFRKQAIIYVVPLMDVDNAYDGGTGKDQLPVDFNRDWDSPSHWNAVNAVKQKMEETASLNSFRFFIDSHNPWPSNVEPQHRLYFYTLYQSGPRSYNVDFYRDLFKEKSGYTIGREPMYPTIGQTSKTYVDSVYAIGLNISMETGWVRRPDDSLWTIERYLRNGSYLGKALSDYINNLPLPDDIIIDNNDSDFVDVTGSWSSSTYIEGFYGTDYIHDNNEAKGFKSVSYNLIIPGAAYYEVFVRWTSDPGRADNVPVNIFYSEGTAELIVNQEKLGAGWVSAGIYYFDNSSPQKIVISNSNTNEYVIADAVRLSRRDSIVLGIEDDDLISSPEDFKLYQNYPNPFNPSTKIKFTIPQTDNPLLGGDGRGGLVTLKVYDVLGNEIATLVNEELPAGEYEVEFSVGRDSSPDIASGIYFYKLQSGKFSETKKMILLK